MVATVAVKRSKKATGQAEEAKHTYPLLLHKSHLDAKIGITLMRAAGSSAVHVHAVAASSEAAKAGVRVGDIVHSIGGVDVDTPTCGSAILKTAPPGFVELVVSSSSAPPPSKTTSTSSTAAGKRPMHSRTPTWTASNEIELLDAPNADEEFAPLVASLMAMGFADEQASLHALKACNGNVEQAVEKLLG